MNIGDKVKFDKYLPLNEAGHNKRITTTIKTTSIALEDGITSEVSHKVNFPIWLRDHKYGVTTFRMNKIPTDLKTGYYIGSIRKKLVRQYTATDSPDEIRRERIRRITEENSGNRPRNWTSRSPNRIDDPNILDELGIIAVSKKKRYVVDMKDIIIASFNDKFKVL